MRLHVYPDVQQLARAAADVVASEIGWAINRRDAAFIALSGGETPWLMIAALRHHPIDWSRTHIFQVDERNAEADHQDRSSTHIRAALVDHIEIPASNLHMIPITGALSHDADQYAQEVDAITGGTFDLIHLGLGDDGHTASLIPDDPVLDISDATTAVTGEYRGYQRVTLTYPILNAARSILWLTNGTTKVEPLQKLLRQDSGIPAGRVLQTNAQVFCDEAAMTAAHSGE